MHKVFSTTPWLLLTIAGFFISCGDKKQATEKKPVQIQCVNVTRADVPLYSEYVGQTYGKSDIRINTRVDGNILQVLFKEGDQVKEGQLLYVVDPISYQAKVEQANGGVEQARSELVNAEENLKRIKPLAQMNAVSQRELDEADARVNVAKAKLKSQYAYLETQKIILGYCNVTAPVSGTIGISNVKEGDYVAALGNKSTLNTISDVSFIRVRFPISENEYLAYAQHRKNVNDSLDISMQLSNGQEYPYKGALNFNDRSVDPLTGSMTFEVTFPNPEKLLVPGQYVRLRIRKGVLANSIVLPERAVREIQGIFQVYIVDDKNALQVRVVKVGQKTDKGWVILEGLEGKERVALLGNNFLTEGTVVEPVFVK